MPDFTSPATLRSQVKRIVDFYAQHAWNPNGGFHQCLEHDGTVCDPRVRHLVSSTRYVYLFATASQVLGEGRYRDLTTHAIAELDRAHRVSSPGLYRWLSDPQQGAVDDTVRVYGLAFAMLAGAEAVKAGFTHEVARIDETWELIDRVFWNPDFHLAADESPGDLSSIDPYRGQNANMHLLEALLSAHEATGHDRYKDRAAQIAHAMAVRQAGLTGGRIWEHYREDWSIDWDFNRHKPDDLFRPWGFQPGHQVEWAKLLIQLESRISEPWMIPRARQLFEGALRWGWDPEYGGLYYSVAPDNRPASTDKYYWVAAEAIGAAAVLWKRTGEEYYREWYLRLWEYVWKHFIDHRHGAWFRVLTRDHQILETVKSPPGKTGYHPVGACVAGLHAFNDPRNQLHRRRVV